MPILRIVSYDVFVTALNLYNLSLSWTEFLKLCKSCLDKFADFSFKLVTFCLGT